MKFYTQWQPMVLGLTLAVSSVFALAGNPQVEMKTNQGVIVIELNPKAAPKTVDNFVQYVKAGFYDGTVFHRVIPGFMIQGGGMTPDLTEKPTRDPIINEGKNGLKNTVGTIAMARRPDPNSATAQFFINVNDNQFLNYTNDNNPGYAVFGKITKGMDVVNKITAVATTNKMQYQDVPVDAVLIEKASMVEEAVAAPKTEAKAAAAKGESSIKSATLTKSENKADAKKAADSKATAKKADSKKTEAKKADDKKSTPSKESK